MTTMPSHALLRAAVLACGVLVIPVAAAGLAAPGAAARAAQRCRGANTPAKRASIPAMRAAVVCLINEQRTARHLPPLHADTRLDSSAQGWSNKMVASHSFAHGNFAGRISAAGLKWSVAGENIASGYATPAQVVKAWMASRGHCENILDPRFRDVGTGVNRHPVAGFATGPATWTQDFALPMGQRPPSRNTGPASGCPY